MSVKPLVEVKNINKSFGPTKALKDVTLKVYPGEIRGLIGENGSGKSTLAAIIAGNLKPDSGIMLLHGEDYKPADSFEGSQKGISIVVQEQGTIGTISVAANIFAGREKLFCKMGFLNSGRLTAQAQKLLLDNGIEGIDAHKIVAGLSFEDRKLVEIARAFYKMPKLFIVDETTTALPQKGRKILYELIDKVKKAGSSVLFISHDIEELIGICDNVTILRDGNVIADLKKDEMEPAFMKSLMVGRKVVENYYRINEDPSPISDAAILSVKNISSRMLKNISFDVKQGEILGVAGLSECGMHELGKVLFGLTKPSSGQVIYKNSVKITSTSLAIKNKIGFVSKNRDTESMLISMNIKDNIVLPSLNNLKIAGFFITPKSEQKLAKEWCRQLNIKAMGISQPCAQLSGGNKQKVVLAKWLANDSDLLILDCPTRGIDVGIKEVIYSIIEELKCQGKSIIIISEELPEVIGMSDRIIVLKDGEVKQTFRRSPSLSEAQIINYMI